MNTILMECSESNKTGKKKKTLFKIKFLYVWNLCTQCGTQTHDLRSSGVFFGLSQSGTPGERKLECVRRGESGNAHS